MKKILLLVAIIYSIIAPLTYHPDTKLVLYYPTLGGGKIWNIYKYLNENETTVPKFHYPPLNYLLVKFELPFVEVVGGKDIDNWLATGSNIAFLDKNIFLYNLASKLPILLLVVVTGLMLYKICIKAGLNENLARRVALIWFLNPITIFSAVIMGQNDILAILPFILGFYFYFDYPILAFLIFGLSAGVKSFPLIWAIAVAGVYPTKNWIKKICFAFLSIIVYFVTLVPFLKYDYFRTDVINSGLAMRMFEQTINFGHGLRIPIVPILLCVVTLVGIKKNLGKNYLALATLLVTLNLIVLSFSNFNPQWFIWLMPFLSILLVTGGEWLALFLMVLALMGITLLFDDKFLYWGLISPINPNLINLPYFSELITHFKIGAIVLNNIFRSMLVAITFYWIYLCAKFSR